MSPLLAARRLTVRRAGRLLCEALDLSIEAGQCWALLGPNGIGKTTLLLHLAGLRTTADGQVTLLGEPIERWSGRERARRLAVLLQHSDPGLGASVLETVLSGRHPHLSMLAWEDREDLRIARGYLTQLGLDGLAGRPANTLSGGELRRVEVARTLTQRGRISLLDEPLSHLDLASQAVVLRVLRQACVGPQRALLMVLHDLNLAYRACDHWLLLGGDGRWHAGPREALARAELLSQIYRHPVTRRDSADGPLFVAQLEPSRGPDGPLPPGAPRW